MVSSKNHEEQRDCVYVISSCQSNNRRPKSVQIIRYALWKGTMPLSDTLVGDRSGKNSPKHSLVDQAHTTSSVGTNYLAISRVSRDTGRIVSETYKAVNLCVTC